jgi:hypothetical protein
MKRILKLADGILDRVLSVIGAVTFSQFPEFVQQYVQRLGGHVDEARRQVALMEEAARVAGKSLNQYMEQFLANLNPDFARQGEIIQQTIQRAAALQEDLQAIQNAPVFTKFFVFLRHMNLEIANSTFANFRPAVPVSLESMVYASIGIILFLLMYHLVLKAPFKLIQKILDRKQLTKLRPHASTTS